MTELRKDLTPDELAEHAAGSSESLPEAVTVNRDAPVGAAGGATHSAGYEPHVEMSDSAGESGAARLPADPPMDPAAQAGA